MRPSAKEPAPSRDATIATQIDDDRLVDGRTAYGN